jgi:MAP/microtubule affinity-regulating kinase
MNQLVRDTQRWKSGLNFEDKMVGPYLLKDFIGEGHTGTVKRATNTITNTESAVKIVSKTITRKSKDARKEIRILQSAKHPNIISLDFFEEDPLFIYIFTPYCDQGDIYSFIERNGFFDEYSARSLTAQMMAAVEFCHTHLKLCHHDVKLENFVLNYEFQVKLIDFGFAIELDPSSAGQKQITVFDSSPAYSALEILLRRPHDESVDIFSLGVCFYFMICGLFPFCDPEKTTYEELVSNVQEGNLIFPPGISLPFQELIEGMLLKTARSNMEDLRNHRWFHCY